MRHYVTFSGAKYHDTTRRIVEDAPKFGADAVHVYDDHWLKQCRSDYWRRMEWFHDHHYKEEASARGVDWFVWKPLVMLDFFHRMADGDVMLFTDADTYPIAPLGPLYETCEREGGIMLFSAVGCIQGIWTKRDCFVAMGCDEPKYHNAQHVVARFMLFQRGGAFPVEKFLGEWLGFTSSPLINTFAPSVLGLPELPGFQQPRCEQSTLTNLAVKYGVPLHREACEWGNSVVSEYADTYLQTFIQDGRHTYRDGAVEADGSHYRTIND